MRSDVAVDVRDDGSGTVTVTVELDEEAAARVPGLAGQLRVDDLRRAGWEVIGPREGADGGLRLTARKPFPSPDQAGRVLAEVGAVPTAEVTRSDSLTGTGYGFAATVDLSRGIETFTDAGLAETLRGLPLGRSPAELEAEAGRPLAEAARFQVRVDLPGGGGREWSPILGDGPTELSTESTVRDWPVLGLLGFALVAMLGGVSLALHHSLKA